MQFNPSKEAIWIDTQETLEKALPALSAGPYLAVDTESNSLYAYREQVCLIQCSTEDEDYLIDGMAGLELTVLGEIFADEGIQKIFHAAEYDIICLRRDYDFQFANLFDTMQAARILGFQQLGLSDMLEGQFRLQPVKSFQKANWGKRPLSDEMKQYARVDTHYLIALREKMAAQLEKNGLMALAQEDFQRLCASENNQHDLSSYTQIRGYHKLSPRELAVLDALCEYRNQKAKQLDRPHFKVIGSRALLAIAQDMPESAAELARVKDLSPRLSNRFGKALLSAVQKGKKAPPIFPEKHKRPSNAYIKRIDALKEWRKKQGNQMGVQSDIILPRDILEAIAGIHPQTMESLKDVMAEVPWRYSHFGQQILDMINKGD